MNINPVTVNWIPFWWSVYVIWQLKSTRWYRKFPDCYCCNHPSERRWEGRPRSHYRKPTASLCLWHHAVNTHCFSTSAFWLCFVLSVMGGKIGQCVYIKFWMKLINPLSKPLKCFVRILANILDAGQWYLNNIFMFKVGLVSVEDDECSGWLSTSKWQKM
jgi:hypothetical protein